MGQVDVLWYLAIVETVRYSITDNDKHYIDAEKNLNVLVENRGKYTERARELLNKLVEIKKN